MPNKNSGLQAICPVCKVAEKSVTNRAIQRHKRREAFPVYPAGAENGAHVACATESRSKNGLSTRVVS